MSRNDPSDLHDDVGGRIDLSADRILEAASQAGISQHADRIAATLSDFQGTYITERIYEEARALHKTYEAVAEDFATSHGLEKPGQVWNSLFPPRAGQGGSDALLSLYDALEVLWTEIRSERKAVERTKGGKQRSKTMLTWAPVFKKEYVGTEDGKMEMRPFNESAKFFLAVARLFDRSYSASNCNAVVDRAKNRRRSREGQDRLKERRRIAAQRSRGKVSNSDPGPS